MESHLNLLAKYEEKGIELLLNLMWEILKFELVVFKKRKLYRSVEK